MYLSSACVRVYYIVMCVGGHGRKKTEKYTHKNTGRWGVVITRCAGGHGLSIILYIPHAADDNAPKVYAFSEILFKSIKKNPNLSTPFDAFIYLCVFAYMRSQCLIIIIITILF